MRRLAVFPLAVVLAACQPAGGPAAPVTEQAGSGTRRGAPSAAVPQALDELLTQARTTAEEWQDGARPAQVEVAVGEDGRWAAARVLYVAADADRYLVVEAGAEGWRQQRPTLAAVDVPPVPEQAVADVPPLPADAREPAALVEGATAPLGHCRVDAVATVLYDTGAPFTWDGSGWTVAPEWTATLLDGHGAGAVVDPVTGAPANPACL